MKENELFLNFFFPYQVHTESGLVRYRENSILQCVSRSVNPFSEAENSFNARYMMRPCRREMGTIICFDNVSSGVGRSHITIFDNWLDQFPPGGKSISANIGLQYIKISFFSQIK